MADFITEELKIFLGGRATFAPTPFDKERTYTRSPQYLLNTTHFHHDRAVKDFWGKLKVPKVASVLDVGCCSGFTGLSLSLQGYRVAFHDYEGLGLEFIRWFCRRNDIEAEIIPYGDELSQAYDIAIALDVLEHTSNHLAFIRWMSDLAHKVVICYPLSIPFSPPYEIVLDEWVDDEAIQTIVSERYKLDSSYVSPLGDRRFMIWRV